MLWKYNKICIYFSTENAANYTIFFRNLIGEKCCFGFRCECFEKAGCPNGFQPAQPYQPQPLPTAIQGIKPQPLPTAIRGIKPQPMPTAIRGI